MFNTSNKLDIISLMGDTSPNLYGTTVPITCYEFACISKITRTHNINIFVYTFFTLYIINILKDIINRYRDENNEPVVENTEIEVNEDQTLDNSIATDNLSYISSEKITPINGDSNSIDNSVDEVFYEDIASKVVESETRKGVKVKIIPGQHPDYIYKLGISLNKYLTMDRSGQTMVRGIYLHHPTSARAYVSASVYPESYRERKAGIDMAYSEYGIPKDQYEAWEYLVSNPYLIPFIIKKNDSAYNHFSISHLLLC